MSTSRLPLADTAPADDLADRSPERPPVQTLRLAVRAIERPDPGRESVTLPLGIAAIDGVLGGGLACGALHEIAAAREAETAAATGFASGLAALSARHHARRGQGTVVWITEDMSLAESGTLYGAGLDGRGLAPERLVTVAAARGRDVLWAMEEALRSPAVAAVIGEVRGGDIDTVATRRLSLAAATHGALGLLLRTSPGDDASTAASRWMIGAAPSPPLPREQRFAVGPPRIAARLMRNRRGQLGSWILQWSPSDESFALAPAHPELVADAAADRPDRTVVGW